MGVIQQMKQLLNMKYTDMAFPWVVGVYSYTQLVVLFMHVSVHVKEKENVYSKNSSLAVCLEKWLADRFSLKTLYFVGYFVYAIGCIVNYFVHQIEVNIIMCFTCKFTQRT